MLTYAIPTESFPAGFQRAQSAESLDMIPSTSAFVKETEFLSESAYDFLDDDELISFSADITSDSEIIAAHSASVDSIDKPTPTQNQVGSEILTQISSFDTLVEKIANKLPEIVSGTGSILSSLSSLLTACGPFCTHALGGLTQATGTLNSAGALSGVPGAGGKIAGLNVDANGNYSFSGSLSDLSQATGISSSELLSGKFSAHDMFNLIVHAMGDGLFSCAHGFCRMMLDWLIPSPDYSPNPA
jgi:hypothetical protein